MARRTGEEQEANESRIIGEADFAKLMKKLDSGEGRLNDAKDEVGGVLKQAIAKYNIHKDALRIIRKYRRKEPAAASEFITCLDHYWILAHLPEGQDDLVEPERAPPKKPKGLRIVADADAPPAA